MAGRRQRGGLFTAALALLGLGIGALALWPRAAEGPDPASDGDAAPTTTTEGAKPGGLDARPAALATAPVRPDAHGFGRPKPVPDGTAIVGIVVDEAGRGVGGARVVAIPDTLSSYQTIDKFGVEGAGGAENFTREDGRFAVEAAGDAPLYVVVAQVRGHPLTVAKGVRVGDDVRLVLSRGVTVSGRVLTKEGDPIEGARVTALTTLDLVVVEETARSAADGTYRVTGLPVWPGEGAESVRSVRVEKEGFSSLLIQGFGRAAMGQRDEFERDLVLQRGATLVGVVVEQDSGRPVGGARVIAWSMDDSFPVTRTGGGPPLKHPWSHRVLAEFVTGADGSFRFESLPARGFHSITSHPIARLRPVLGYVSARAEGTVSISEEVPLIEDGGHASVTLQLLRASTVSGRVLRPDGSPAVGVSVWWNSGGNEGNPYFGPPPGATKEPVEVTKTGVDGAYRLDAVPASARGARRVTVNACQRADVGGPSTSKRASVDVDVIAGLDATAADLTLSGSDDETVVSPLVLVVRDDAGEPVGGATWQPIGNRSPYTSDAVALRSGRDGRVMVRTPGGRLPETVVVRALGFGVATVSLPRDANPGTEVPVVLPRERRVAGRVVDSMGQPVPTARVSAYDGNVALDRTLHKGDVPAWVKVPGVLELGSSSVRADGSFEIRGLPPGPYHVVAHRSMASPSGGAACRTSLSSVPGDAVDLVLALPPEARPAGGRILGSLVDGDTGRVIARAEVTAVRRRGADEPPEGPRVRRAPGGLFLSGPRVMVEWLTPGTFEVSNTEVGTYDLTVHAAGYVPVSLVAEVPAGRDVTLAQTVLSRGVRLHGEVRWPEGASPGDRTLTLVAAEPVGPRSSAEVAASTPLPAKGRYALTGLRPGRYRVMASPAGFGGRGVLSSFLREGDAPVVIAEGVRDVEVDLVFAVAGSLTLQCYDPRLPPVSGLGGSEATEAQKAFGRGSSLTVYDAAGRVLAETASLESGVPWSMLRLVLLPGPCVVRLRLASGEIIEERAGVDPGVDTSVAIGSGPRALR